MKIRHYTAILLTCFFGLSDLMAQLPVSQTPENKNVILEEFTGIYCTFCPDGHKLASQFQAANPGDVVIINIHSGSFASPSGNDPDFRTIHGTLIASSAGIVGYPAGTINRRLFSQYTQGSGTAMSRGDWSKAGAIILGEASYVNIAMDAVYDISTNKIYADVEMYLTGSLPSGSNLSLVVALLQNNVEGPQTGKNSNPSQVLPNGMYNHSHMLRDLLSTSRFGDNVDFSSGPMASMNFVYDVPASIGGIPTVADDMELVAYLLETPSYEIVTGCESVMQVGFLGKEELSVNSDFRIYPNPAANEVNIRFSLEDNSEIEIEVVDLSGKVVHTLNKNYTSSGEQTEVLDISGLASGSYLLRTSINGNTSYNKLVVQ